MTDPAPVTGGPLDADGADPDDGAAVRAQFRARGSYASAGVQESRAFLRRVRRPGGPSVASVADAVVGLGREVPARVYDPAPGQLLPLLLWTHGGGWCVGDLDTTDTVCRHLATGTGCVVVSLDHRLAPEHSFPAALDDVGAALRWALGDAARAVADPGRVVVAGESSGANLTLAALLQLRDAAPELVGRIRHQVLVVPLADLEDRPSMRADADPGLTVADLRRFEARYVPDPQQRRDDRVFPLRATSLAGLPPATVVTAGRDPLRDGGVALAGRLAVEGSDLVHLHRAAAGHGLLGDLSPGGAGEQVLSQVCDVVRRSVVDAVP